MMMWAALINYCCDFYLLLFIWMVFDIYRPRFYYGMDQKEHLFGFGFIKVDKMKLNEWQVHLSPKSSFHVSPHGNRTGH
jgi:hypothetical protein